jgi:hypothetical protein
MTQTGKPLMAERMGHRVGTRDLRLEENLLPRERIIISTMMRITPPRITVAMNIQEPAPRKS